MTHGDAPAGMMFVEESDEDNIESAMRQKRNTPSVGRVEDGVDQTRKRQISGTVSAASATPKTAEALSRDNAASIKGASGIHGENGNRAKRQKTSNGASGKAKAIRTGTQLPSRPPKPNSVAVDATERNASRPSAHGETAEERKARLLRMRNERASRQGKTPVENLPGRRPDNCPEAPEDDWTVEDALRSHTQRTTPPMRTSEERANAQRDREAEKKRKEESRARAQMKARRGKAIPIVKSYIAPRSSTSRKKAPPKEYPVDFGSDESTEDSAEDEEQEWEVEDIYSHKVKDGVIKYEVKWLGWDSDDNTWEPEENLVDNAGIILGQYKDNHMKKKSHTAPVAPMSAPMAPPMDSPTVRATETNEASSANDNALGAKTSDTQAAANSTPSAPTSSIASGFRDSIHKLGVRLWSTT